MRKHLTALNNIYLFVYFLQCYDLVFAYSL